MDTIALIVGYAALLSTTIIIIIALWFWIADKIAFRKYQKKGEKRIMDYAKKHDSLGGVVEKSNTFVAPLGDDIFIVCKN